MEVLQTCVHVPLASLTPEPVETHSHISQVPSDLSVVELSLQMPRDGSVAPKF